MADFHKVNARNIVGGAGRLVFKPWDGTYPTSIEEVIGLTTPYDLVGPYEELGGTVDGITIARAFETEDFSVDQTGVIDSDITGWTHSLSTNLAENTVKNRQLALVGGEIQETAPVLGTATVTTTNTVLGGTILNVTTSEGFVAGSYLQVEGVSYLISSVQGTTITLSTPVTTAVASGASVAPVTALGSRRIGYGTVSNIPFFTFVLISKKKDESLYMAVFRKCKATGDDKEQVFGTEKRLLPLGMAAYPDESAPSDENVYYEIEQIV